MSIKRVWIWLLAGIGTLSISAAQVVPDRYIVELAGEPAVTRAALRSGSQANRISALREHHPAIRAEQRQVGAELEARQVRVLASVHNVANALMVQAHGMTRQQLEQIPGVKRVHAVRLYHLATDHATGLQKMPDAWAQIGGYAMAGKGIKIGIIDTGIDITHPGFANSDLTMPSGFPQVDKDVNRQYTNGKVIIAKSYDPTAADASDREGHGTAVAMIAAGWPNSGPNGLVIGMAPEAYLGNYKVFPDNGGAAGDDYIIEALDDALGDGMDVVNLSLGSIVAFRPELDPLVQAVERAATYGVIVVIAAGNDGPELDTMASPGIAPSAITVGNSWNDRVFAGSAVIDGAGTYPVVPASGAPYSPASGALLDVSTLDQDGLACNAFPAGSLTNHVALILRGTCTFEVKLNNAQTAGATAALVYATAASPDAFTMSVGAATLPARDVEQRGRRGGESQARRDSGPQGIDQFRCEPGLGEFGQAQFQFERRSCVGLRHQAEPGGGGFGCLDGVGFIRRPAGIRRGRRHQFLLSDGFGRRGAAQSGTARPARRPVSLAAHQLERPIFDRWNQRVERSARWYRPARYAGLADLDAGYGHCQFRHQLRYRGGIVDRPDADLHGFEHR